MKDRSEWIDSFKGLAILGVIMVHFGIGELSEVYEPYISSGRYGVQIFFIISAYLAFVSFEKIRKQNVFSWYRKKLIRILPLYWTSIYLMHMFFTRINIEKYLLKYRNDNPYWNWVLGYLLIVVLSYGLAKIFNSIEVIIKRKFKKKQVIEASEKV